MKKEEEKIFNVLDQTYPKEITFIKVKSPFEYLVTVMLSASSQDKKAIEVSALLFSKYKTIKSLAEANENEVEEIIRPVGLGKTKSHNIIALAKFVVKNENIPNTFDSLTKLDGIGEKTASCYLSALYNQNCVIADIHFIRVSNRLGFTNEKDPHKVVKDIKRTFPESKWTRLSMTVNKLGRDYCRPKPKCQSCFLNSLCPSSKASS